MKSAVLNEWGSRVRWRPLPRIVVLVMCTLACFAQQSTASSFTEDKTTKGDEIHVEVIGEGGEGTVYAMTCDLSVYWTSSIARSLGKWRKISAAPSS